MAQRQVYTDTNYSSLTFLDNDTIYVDYLATLTITTDTSAIGGISFGGNGAGKVVINNTSTTTPIFIKVSGSITLTRDAIFESNGNLIEIGTGDGSTRTYNLPTGAGSSKYSDLGACWVDRGATFRDGTSYKTTYAQVSSLSNKLSAYTFGDVFSQDTTANTITFLKPVPNGCKVYVPNIQIIGTHVSNSIFSSQGRINLNYTSLSKIVNFGLNGAVDFKLNYCGLGFCQTTGFSNSRRMAGGVTILNTGFNWSYYWDIYGSAIGAVIKNVYYVSNLNAGSIYPTAQGPGLYIEKYTSIFDKDDCGDPTSGNSNNILLQISCPAGKVYDVYLGSTSQVLNINTTGTTYDNIVIVPTGNIVSSFSRSISNVTNNGSGLIRITTSANMIVSTHQIVKITGVGGVTNANGTWRVNQISNTQFDLAGSSFSGTYTPATGIANSYASNNRTLFYVSDNATKNVLTNISIIPAYDVPVDPTHGTLHRGIYTLFSNTGNNYNTFTNCTFSLQSNYGLAPMLVERGTYNTYNKVTVTDSSGIAYAQRGFQFDQESYGIVAANWTNLSASQVFAGGTYTYFGSKIERVLLDEDTPATDFGYNFTFTGIDSPSILAFTNINKTTGRVFALNSLSASVLSMEPSPLNTGPYTVKESKLYIRNTGDSVAFETSVYGGVTGIDSFCARDESMSTILAKDATSTIDCPYQYALSMRRPNGVYTTPKLVYGSRLTGSNQSANYNVGNTVAQTIATGLTAFGTVDLINSTELRICDITTLSSTPNPNYLWGHFLDNVTTAMSGTSQGIRNITTGYVPPSNPFTNQYEYIPSKTINALNSALTSLPAETRIKNQVQFKVHVIRDIKDNSNSTYDQRFFGAAIDVKLDPNYIVPVGDPTYLNLTLNGGYISIYDDIGELKYYTNQDQLITLPLDSVGTWTFKYAKYGYKMGLGQFSINQKTNEIAPIVSPDFYLTESSVSLVSAYNTFSTTQNIYDYLSFYRTTSAGLGYGDLNQYSSTLDIGSKQLILSDTTSPAFSYDGSKFIIKSSSIQGRAITTTGGIILSGSNTFSNITLNANVSSNAVNNLNTVNVNGILTYNTNTSYNITYTNTNVLTAKNDSSGIINIKRINSTITDATDAQIQSFQSTFISLTLQSGYIAIYDNNGVQQYYRNTDTNSSPIELPYAATGTWTYKIARYGYKLVTGSFTINSAIGGTVTIAPIYVQDIYVSDTVGNVMSYTTFYKTQQVYDYLSYYRTTSAGLSAGDLNLYSSTLDIGSNNIILFDSASPVFSYDGSTFTLNSLNLSGAAIKTTGTISLSGNSAISDIILTTDVLDQTPADLTNVTINGTLAYSTNTPASITYTNTTVSTVVNDPYSAKILIKRVNSSINNATDPEIDDYAPTVINVTPNGGSVAIYNDTTTREYFIKDVSTVVLPYSATGAWSYRVAKYGFDLINQPFTINSSTGATINIVPNYIPDNFIDALEANVENYTDLNNASEIHDYLMYFQTLSTGIDYGDLEFETFGTVTFTNGLALSADAPSMVSLSGTTVVLKSTYLTDDIILVSTYGNITQHSGNTISDGIKLRANNLDSEIYFNTVDSITFYPNATDRDNNVNGNITLTSATIYRFKYGATVSGITFTNYVYARVTVGGATLLVSTPIALGTNTIDFGVTGNLQTLNNNLKIVNDGVKKSSILVPHTTNI